MSLRDPAFVRALIGMFEQQVQDALDFAGNTHAIADLVDAVVEERMQLWLGAKSIVLTEVRDTPRKRLLEVFLAAGETRDILSMQDHVAAWARSVGCVEMHFGGRLGWERALNKTNWRRAYVVMRRDLQD